VKVKRQGYAKGPIEEFNLVLVYCLGSLLILSSRAEHDFLNIATESLDPNDSYHDHEFILPHEDMESTGFYRSQDRSGG
jgi:hypothetical protein